MNTKKHQWLLYFITITIVVTIGVQFYWNYKNYEENKQRVRNEIQLSLDNALEEYYSSLAKSNFLTIVNSENNSNGVFKPQQGAFSQLLNQLDKFDTVKSKPRVSINNIKITSTDTLSQEKIDSMMNSVKTFAAEFNTEKKASKRKRSSSKTVMTKFLDEKNGFHLNENGDKTSIKYFKGKKAADSLKFLTNLQPIFISFFNPILDYHSIDSLITKQLEVKGIDIKSSFIHLKNDTLFHQSKDSLFDKNFEVVRSKSTYVKENEQFELAYKNPNLVALQRSTFGIFLSFLLASAVISSLFYLLQIIKQQKELAAIKNDLISNITHEFKTPIATVTSAIEAIENFNVLDDKEKTKKYLSMSTTQLNKLHQMVEKLLETATLDSDQLLLEKEKIDVVDLIDTLVTKHQMICQDKEIRFQRKMKPLYAEVDVFHFENVISNLIDNAVKYGGKLIDIEVNSNANMTEIQVSDNGKGIEKNQRDKIFDKFYRVPKGNTHDVKGFGIGLYYCKNIVEKHNGKIQLKSTENKNIFNISIPNE